MNKKILPSTSSRTNRSVRKSRSKTSSLIFFSCILLVFLGKTNAVAEFCCTREVIPLPIKMPPEQESDCGGYIAAVILPTLREAGIFSCLINRTIYEYKQVPTTAKVEFEK